MSDNEFEARIEALIDGELMPAEIEALEEAVRADAGLAEALSEAHELKQMLAGMPKRQAPRSLQRRLKAIPEQAGESTGWSLWPRLSVAFATALAVLVLVDINQPASPSGQEIEQGRRELALALGYLGQATGRVSTTLDNRIDSAVVAPLTDHTAAAIGRTPILNEEYQL